MKHDELRKKAEAQARPEFERLVEAELLELLVDEFAKQMKAKLLDSMDRHDPYAWAHPEWHPIDRLKTHIEKDDPIDVANFALFWWDRLANPEDGAQHP